MLKTLVIGIPKAAANELACKISGHRPDTNVPSPPGLVYCSRCKRRVEQRSL